MGNERTFWDKLLDWAADPVLPDVLCRAMHKNVPCELCWPCVGIMALTVTLLLVLSSYWPLIFITLVIGVTFMAMFLYFGSRDKDGE